MSESTKTAKPKVSNSSQSSSETKPSASVSKEVSVEHKNLLLGGRSKEPCYCLLDGFLEDPEDAGAEKSRITIPITKLPATIGRSHDKDSDDPHFFGLGSKKALSRKHCRISYRDALGGKVEWDTKTKGLSYKEPSGDGKEGHAVLNVEDTNKLPSRGFFVIECLGKNRILVNQERVEQGNAAVVASGSSLRVSSYTLYFLLPTDADPAQHVIALAPDAITSSKKRKVASDAAASAAASSKRSKAQQDEMDSLPVENLLEKMAEAIENNQWERRHQLIGATIALHAVRESAMDPKIQSKALDGGVSRSDVMVWIEESPKFSKWVQQMLTKMEPRSYQAAITKCLLKGGFTRTGSSGRYIKWYLPKDIPISPHVTKKEDNRKDAQSKSKDKKGKLVEGEEKNNGEEKEGEEDAETGGGEEGQEEGEEEKSEGEGENADEENVDDEDEEVANDDEDEGDEDGSDFDTKPKNDSSPAVGKEGADDSNAEDDET